MSLFFQRRHPTIPWNQWVLMGLVLLRILQRNRTDNEYVFYKRSLLDWLTWHKMGSTTMAVFILDRLRTLLLLSPWCWCLSSSKLVLKTWRTLREPYLFNAFRKVEETGFRCYQWMAEAAAATEWMHSSDRQTKEAFPSDLFRSEAASGRCCPLWGKIFLSQSILSVNFFT